MRMYNRNTFVALATSAIAFLLFMIAFVSPYWLVNDGMLSDRLFNNLGLWEVCFQNFQHIRRFYDPVFNKCMWVFEEEYYIIHDFLLTGFYITVQLFATLCFMMCLLALLLTFAFLRASRDDDRYVFLLLTMGSCEILGSIFGFIAISIFGAKGDSRDWMPGWQHNDMGWSFALGVVGTIMLLPGGVLYIVEARRERYKRLNEISNREISECVLGDDQFQHQGQQYFAAEPSRPRRPHLSQRATTAISHGGIQTDI